jgi:hypothetical protein
LGTAMSGYEVARQLKRATQNITETTSNGEREV